MPPFNSSVSILLTADAADSLLQVLENSVHVPPALLSLHQLLIDEAHCQGDLMNGIVEGDAYQSTANTRARLQGQLWTPEPMPGLPDTLSPPHTLDVPSDLLLAPTSSDVPSLAGHRRAQFQVEGSDYVN
ncbi:uncharacterized protein EDB91DRAFT_1249521 [Suillus paluster]|uniref:uncharacterized protein n=1 Tax=Suillus paluster TaxID=48578 RepID=UPI001B8871F6|nr:uncharacterized protein EDB91DRAFT_1249521 [Suillus paluster]KAG1737844.1 hypothetical protein EDB91DRAFT_1249521 [Suillus paluster]